MVLGMQLMGMWACFFLVLKISPVFDAIDEKSPIFDAHFLKLLKAPSFDAN